MEGSTATIRLGGAGLPLVVGIDMGYGHMRPATALADALGVEALSCDREPLAGEEEIDTWRRNRRLYEWLTRVSSVPGIGVPLRPFVAGLTAIPPLHAAPDPAEVTWPVRRLVRAIEGGIGRRLVEVLRETGRPLLTTYFAPAHAADAAGIEHIWCVVTDSDVHRVWAPPAPATSRIRYLVPSARARRRLVACGVTPSHIEVTGYPLPGALLGGPDLGQLRRNLAARLVRLDPHGTFRAGWPGDLAGLVGPWPASEEGRPPHLVFAVGGAGAQSTLPAFFLPSLRPLVEAGRLRVTLVAGVRVDVAARLEAAIRRAGLEGRRGDGIEVLRCDTLHAYFAAFDALMATTDVLWTKPSELTFFGALGLPLVLAPPIGAHERHNRRWARERGVGLPQRALARAGRWLTEWIEDGVLAGAALAGYAHLPARGLHRILERVGARIGA